MDTVFQSRALATRYTVYTDKILNSLEYCMCWNTISTTVLQNCLQAARYTMVV